MNIVFTNRLSIDDYNKLRESVGWGVCETDRVTMALTRSDYIIVAESDGETVGAARVMHDGLQALIMDVMVLPEYQGRGVGKALMEHVMEYLDEISRHDGIFVNLMSAVGREGFYEQFGFTRRPGENRGPGMTLWFAPQRDARCASPAKSTAPNRP